jgi:hypothetical protein
MTRPSMDRLMNDLRAGTIERIVCWQLDGLGHIATGDTTGLEALLPDRWLADHPEHRLEQREEKSRDAQARRRRKRAARRIAVAQ